jgi:hypothetical protein
MDMERVVIAAGLDETPNCTTRDLEEAWLHLLSIPSNFATPVRKTQDPAPRTRRTIPTVYQDDDDGEAVMLAAAARRARLLVEHARISDAASALMTPSPPARPTPATTRALMCLHPQEPPLTPQENEALGRVERAGVARSAEREQAAAGVLRKRAGRGHEDVAHELPPKAGHAILHMVREATATTEELARRGILDAQEREDLLDHILESAGTAIAAGMELGAPEMPQPADPPPAPARQAARLQAHAGPGDGGDAREPDIEIFMRSERQAQIRSRASTRLLPDIPAADIRDLVEHLPRHRAPGPSGLTYEMIVQLNGRDGYAWELFAVVIRLLLIGRGGPSHVLGAARLIALKKGPRAIRPIAVGETLNRITGLVATRTAEPALREVLAPVQFGVAVPGGTEATGWAAHLARVGGAALCNVDVRNAFNSVTRRSILQAVARLTPSLLPITHWALRFPTPLIMRPHDRDTPPFFIPSATGTPQGWPLSPALFALAIHDVLATTRRAIRHLPSMPTPTALLQDLPRDLDPDDSRQRITRLARRLHDEADVPRPDDEAIEEVISLTGRVLTLTRLLAEGSIGEDDDLVDKLHSLGEGSGASTAFDDPDVARHREQLQQAAQTGGTYEYTEDTATMLAIAIRDARHPRDAAPRLHTVKALALTRTTAIASAPMPGWVSLWDKIRKLANEEERRLVVPTELAAYADDINMAGTPTTAVWGFVCIRRCLAPRGMRVNDDKSTLLLPGGSPHIRGHAEGDADWTRGVYIERQRGPLAPELHDFAPTITAHGIDVTGTPVGTQEYCKRVACDTARATEQLVDRLSMLPAHHASLILRLSASTKFKHLLRVLPGDTVLEASALHDRAILRGLVGLVGPPIERAAPAAGGLSIATLLDTSILKDPAIRRATMALHLPVRFGGMGIIAAQRVSNAALLGGYTLVASLLAERTPSVAPTYDQAAPDFRTDARARWRDAANMLPALQAAAAGLRQRAADTSLRTCADEPVHKLQRLLTRRDSEAFLWNGLAHMAVESEARSERPRGLAARYELAWRIDLCSRGAGAYMHQIPVVRNLQLTDADVRSIYMTRIGAHFDDLQEGRPAACDACGTRVAIDPLSVAHAMACSAGTRVLRHDGATRELAAALQLCGATVLTEEACVPQRVNPIPQSSRRMDLVVRLQQKLYAVDVTICSVRLNEIKQDGTNANVARVLDRRDNHGTPIAISVMQGVWGCVSRAGVPPPECPLTGARYEFPAPGQPGPGRATPEDVLGLRAAYDAAERRKTARYGTTVRARDPGAPDRGVREMPLVVFGASTGGGLNAQARDLLREAAESEPAAEAAAGRGYALTKARLLVSAAVSTAIQRGNAKIWRAHASRVLDRQGGHQWIARGGQGDHADQDGALDEVLQVEDDQGDGGAPATGRDQEEQAGIRAQLDGHNQEDRRDVIARPDDHDQEGRMDIDGRPEGHDQEERMDIDARLDAHNQGGRVDIDARLDARDQEERRDIDTRHEDRDQEEWGGAAGRSEDNTQAHDAPQHQAAAGAGGGAGDDLRRPPSPRSPGRHETHGDTHRTPVRQGGRSGARLEDYTPRGTTRWGPSVTPGRPATREAEGRGEAVGTEGLGAPSDVEWERTGDTGGGGGAAAGGATPTRCTPGRDDRPGGAMHATPGGSSRRRRRKGRQDSQHSGSVRAGDKRGRGRGLGPPQRMPRRAATPTRVGPQGPSNDGTGRHPRE